MEIRKPIRAWVSKYALTLGVFEVEAQQTHTASMICVKALNCHDQCFHGEGREWHRTEAEARERANAMVQTKIKSLKTQLKRYEAMSF